MSVDKHTYLMSASNQEVLDTWYSTGSTVCNKNTKMYTKDVIYRIDASDGDWLSKAPLHNRMMMCVHTYTVDNNLKLPIDWSIMQEDDMHGIYAALEGIMVPYFVLLKAKWEGGFMPTNNFIPYSDASIDIESCINIDDEELEIILTAIGLPFVLFAELELSKAEIIKYCIKPAMQKYFTFRPIIEEQPGYRIAQGSEFMVPFPMDAYSCIPYYSVPGSGSGAASGTSGSPFSFYNEQMMVNGLGGMGGRFGRGIRYHGKQVPGFTGNVGMQAQLGVMDQLAAAQGMLNFYRREKYTRKKINGVLYAYGFSTIGGALNFKWLKASRNWDDVKFEDLEPIARPMARIEVLNNFALIRSLVKQDIAGQLDPTVLRDRAKELTEELKPILNAVGTHGALAVMRGGG